jgi:TetR/AcrR family transcriptional regulator
MVDQVVQGIFKQMVSIFRAGQETGELRSGLDPALCATLLMGADLFFFQAQGVLKFIPEAGFTQRPSQFTREMVDILLNGMREENRGGRKQ